MLSHSLYQANLRACSEELHNHILELQQEVESLKVMVETVTKEKVGPHHSGTLKNSIFLLELFFLISPLK